MLHFEFGRFSSRHLRSSCKLALWLLHEEPVLLNLLQERYNSCYKPDLSIRISHAVLNYPPLSSLVCLSFTVVFGHWFNTQDRDEAC